MPEKNALIPDIHVTALSGERFHLWDFRQKVHLLLLVGDAAGGAAATLAEKQKIIDWLNLKVIACAPPPPDFGPGAHLIDRYGRYITLFPIDATLGDRVEKELVYYEARHC